jgi:hypothetical protein
MAPPVQFIDDQGWALGSVLTVVANGLGLIVLIVVYVSWYTCTQRAQECRALYPQMSGWSLARSIRTHETLKKMLKFVIRGSGSRDGRLPSIDALAEAVFITSNVWPMKCVFSTFFFTLGAFGLSIPYRELYFYSLCPALAIAVWLRLAAVLQCSLPRLCVVRVSKVSVSVFAWMVLH